MKIRRVLTLVIWIVFSDFGDEGEHLKKIVENPKIIKKTLAFSETLLYNNSCVTEEGAR